MIFDNAHQPLTPAAVVGRRALRWCGPEQGFGAPATIRQVQMLRGDERPTHAVLAYDDPRVRDELVPLTEVMIPAVTDRMVADGASAISRAREQGFSDEPDVLSRVVLVAAIEGRS